MAASIIKLPNFILKLFFRELPSPLITPKTRVQYNRWCQIPSFFNDDDGLIAELKAIIKESLDEPSRMTVKILFNHFCKGTGRIRCVRYRGKINDNPVKSCCREFKKPNGGTQPCCGLRSYSYRKSGRECFI